MKKILLPTDFSENSKDALAYAVQLFKGTPCCFYILNTYDQIVASDHFDVTVTTNIKTLQVLKENSQAQLIKIKTQLENAILDSSQQCKIISQMNTLTGAVKEIVNEEHIDAIIMGTKGETSSSNIIFGSNTLQVINKRIAPVIVVPTGYKFRDLKDILFPTDLQIEFTNKHLAFLIEIAKQTKSKITLLHRIFRGLNAYQRNNKNTLEHLLTEVNTSFEIIEDKEIDDAVYEYEQSHATELLVMINNKHSLIENLFFTPVVSKIVGKTEIPFLVIPS